MKGKFEERKVTHEGLEPTSPEYISDTLPTELTGQLEIERERSPTHGKLFFLYFLVRTLTRCLTFQPKDPELDSIGLHTTPT